MKKAFLLLSGLIILAMLSGQVFEKEITTYSGLGGVANKDLLFHKNSDHTVNILNKELDVIKIITTLPNDYYSISLVIYNYFTTSNKYEFILIYTDEKNKETYKLYDETGAFLFDFEEFMPNWNFGSIFENKFITYAQFSPAPSYQIVYRFYTVSGNTNTLQQTSKKTNKVYPNPAFNTIHINYTTNNIELLTISTIDGKIIDNILLDPY